MFQKPTPDRKRHRPLLTFMLAGLAVIGASLSAAHAQLLRDAEIEQWLHDYTAPLLEAAGIPPESVGLHIVGDSSLNAFVTNGLNMYVHTGLITRAEVPNQVQGVIAHETGHLAGGHLSRKYEAYANASRPVLLSMVLGAAAVMAGSADAGLAVFSLGQTIGQSQFLSYNRGQEASADQAGVKLLEDIGVSGKGLVDFFKILRNQQLISARSANPYLQTHPLPSARVETLERLVQASPYYDKQDSPEEIARFRLIQAKIEGFMNDTFTTLRKYPLSDQSDPAKYARAVAYYRASDLDKALKEINYLIDEHEENPFFYELKGQMLFEHGRVAESVEPHRKSVALAPQYSLLRINLGRALVALNDPDALPEAIKVLNTALDMEPSNAFGWTELARAYSQAGDDTMASLAQAEAFFAAGNKAEAHRFATRALNGLSPQTPEWRQASDIVSISQSAAEKQRRNPKRAQ